MWIKTHKIGSIIRLVGPTQSGFSWNNKTHIFSFPNEIVEPHHLIFNWDIFNWWDKDWRFCSRFLCVYDLASLARSMVKDHRIDVTETDWDNLLKPNDNSAGCKFLASARVVICLRVFEMSLKFPQRTEKPENELQSDFTTFLGVLFVIPVRISWQDKTTLLRRICSEGWLQGRSDGNV